MCSFGMAGLALGALSGGASAIGGYQQRRAQYQAQLQQAEMQRRFQAQAAEAQRMITARQITGARLRQQQQQEELGRAKEQERLQAQAKAGTFKAVDRGVTGLSQNLVLGEYFANLGRTLEVLNEQGQRLTTGTGLAIEDIGLAGQQRLVSINQPIAQPIKPSFGLSDALAPITGGLSGYMTGRQLGISNRPPVIDTGSGYATYMPSTDQYLDPYYAGN